MAEAQVPLVDIKHYAYFLSLESDEKVKQYSSQDLDQTLQF